MDPILLTVITNRLEGITREMGAGMLRSSRSPIFAENKDFVTAVFDRRLRLVAQTAYIPVLMGASPFAVKAVSDLYCPLAGEVVDVNEELDADPALVNNDPYGEGWMIRLRVEDPEELEELLDADGYGVHIG